MTVSRFNHAGGLRRNISANYLARIISILLAVSFTPIYIKILGVEMYGIIGFYISLQAAMGILELGLSTTCNRELARLSARDDTAQEIRNTLRTFEWVYISMAALIGLMLSFSASWLDGLFLNTALLTQNAQITLIQIMAWIIAMRWPLGLYLGALSGLQKQVPMNVLLILGALLNWGGGAAALWLISPSIQTFFEWQLIASALTVAMFHIAAWQLVPKWNGRAHFSSPVLQAQLSFIGGAGLNAALGAILMQADKLVLSSVLHLKEFAYYALAAMVAEALLLLATPISNGISPRLTQMIASGKTGHELIEFFHKACQFINLILIPAGLVIAIFSSEVLFAYTGSHEVAKNAGLILSILISAKLLHGNMLIPYALQVGWGQLKTGVYLNVASVCWLISAIYLLVPKFGTSGAAWAWLTVTLGYVFIGMPIIFGKLMPHEWWRWFSRDLLVPLAGVALALFVGKWLQGESITTRGGTVALLALYGLIAAVIASLMLSSTRAWLINKATQWITK